MLAAYAQIDGRRCTFTDNSEQLAPLDVTELERVGQPSEGVWMRPTPLTRLERGDRRGAQLCALG